MVSGWDCSDFTMTGGLGGSLVVMGTASFGEEGEDDDEEGELEEDGGVALGGGVFLEDAEGGDDGEE